MAVSLKAIHHDAWWTRDLVNGMEGIPFLWQHETLAGNEGVVLSGPL